MSSRMKEAVDWYPNAAAIASAAGTAVSPACRDGAKVATHPEGTREITPANTPRRGLKIRADTRARIARAAAVARRATSRLPATSTDHEAKRDTRTAGTTAWAASSDAARIDAQTAGVQPRCRSARPPGMQVAAIARSHPSGTAAQAIACANAPMVSPAPVESSSVPASQSASGIGAARTAASSAALPAPGRRWRVADSGRTRPAQAPKARPRSRSSSTKTSDSTHPAGRAVTDRRRSSAADEIDSLEMAVRRKPTASPASRRPMDGMSGIQNSCASRKAR